MVDFGDLVAQGSNAARKAIALDNNGQYSAALNSYKESIKFLDESLASSSDLPTTDRVRESIRERILGYEERCEAIKNSGLLPQPFRLSPDHENHVEFVDDDGVEIDSLDCRPGEIAADGDETEDLEREIEEAKKKATLYTKVLAAAEGAEMDHRRDDDSIASSNSTTTNNTNCAVHNMPFAGIVEEERDPRMEEERDPRMVAMQQQLKQQQRQITALSTDLMVAVARNSAFEQKLDAGARGDGEVKVADFEF